MKQIVCEMCGGTELLKQEGLYVCQYCGAKYSLEEAKKLMVEIDNSKKLVNLRERAKKSLEVGDLKHAAEYYKQILDEEPNDWEAYFYSYLGEHTSYTNGQAGTVAAKLGNTIPTAYDMAIEGVDAEEAGIRIGIITNSTLERIKGIALSADGLLRQYEGGNSLTPKGQVTKNMYDGMRSMVADTLFYCVLALTNIDEKLLEISKKNVDTQMTKSSLIGVRRVRFDIANLSFESSFGVTEKLFKKEVIADYAEKIKELQPDFEIPKEEKYSSSSEGCYVATAVYGSYDCPQVWTLRRYRDYTLATTWYGRVFIRVYYATSPTLVKWFGHTSWFKNIWKNRLDSMVLKLQTKGFEDTPYQDKKW